MRRRRCTLALAAAMAGVALAVGGCTTAPPAASDGPGAPQHIESALVTRVVPPADPAASTHGMTVVEGPTIGPDGQLYMVDFTAPAGEPKILRVDLRTNAVAPVHTDATSVYSSLQRSPVDGMLYATDFQNGKIDRLALDGSGFTTVFSGPVAGRPMVPDDIAFNRAGEMYVADYQGSPQDRTGRVVRLDASGANPVVVQDGLCAPNGISFTPDFSGLWVSEYSLGEEKHLALAPDGRKVVETKVAMTTNIGTNGLDSNTVDAAGNVYQAVMGAGKILVWNPGGDLIATVVVPQNDESGHLVSNLAIAPGTTDAYVTVGGRHGGFVYRFAALAPGIPQSNGGGA